MGVDTNRCDDGEAAAPLAASATVGKERVESTCCGGGVDERTMSFGGSIAVLVCMGWSSTFVLCEAPDHNPFSLPRKTAMIGWGVGGVECARGGEEEEEWGTGDVTG